MNILFATNNFYIPQSAGGSESSTHDLCNLLNQRQIKCAVLSDLKSEGMTYLKNRVKAKVLSKNFPSDNFLGYPVYRGWDPSLGVKEVVNSFKPDFAVIQAGKPILLADEFIKNNIKTIIYLRDVEFHNHGGTYTSNPLLNFIANSEFTAKTFKEAFNIQAKVITPIVNTDNYRVNSNKEKVVFICPSPLKGVELAFQLAEKNPSIPFLFVESWYIPDEQKKIYKDRAEKYQNIEWLEKQQDMQPIYSQAKIMLVPSLCREAWGRIPTESQVSGIPTLASNRGGLPESVGEGGITLDPENNFGEWNMYLNKLWFNEGFYDIQSEKAYKYSQRKQIQSNSLISKFINYLHTL